MSITIGTDPELFLRDTRTGAATPVCGLLGGTKGAAIPMAGLSEGYGLQEDNVMVEYNVPPATRSRRFAASVEQGLNYITQVVHTSLPHHTVDVGACSRLFSDHDLLSKQAQVFGCSPDFNAYKQGDPWPAINPEQLKEPDGGAWRFAGGHVHLGFEAQVPEYVAASFADVFIGLPSVAMDNQGPRRALYGQAGRYRPTPWGIEYRTLSNFWIWDRGLRQEIGDRAFAMCNYMESVEQGEMQQHYMEMPWPDVRRAINTEDASIAADLLAYARADLRIKGV